MHSNLLETFKEITGLPEEYIRHCCDKLPLEEQVILEFYMHFRRFPTYYEACFIGDIGLSNFNALMINGISVFSTP